MKAAGYYGRPIVKPPEWTALIPLYFWAGGMGGACAALALRERLANNDRMARTLIFGAAAASALSGFCLVADLRKPERFPNMLRVFKPSSPMSVGVYIFSVFAGASSAAAASEVTGIAPRLGRAAETVAGLTGPWMSVYTAVLLGDTVMPAWYYARNSLPLLFASTSISTASGFGMLFAPESAAGARRLALIASVAIPVAFERLRGELGPVQQKAYERGRARKLVRLARLLNTAGAVTALFGKRERRAAQMAGLLLLLGGLAERFAVVEAGRYSAKDPSFVIAGQRS